MKKLLYYFLLYLICISTQICFAITIIPSQYETVQSHEGIVVKNITINDDKSLTVNFENANSSNYSTTGTYVTNTFDWYLSYKGKRISDYYTEAIRCGQKSSHTVFYWPGEVPNGDEKYITVQLGRERKKRDRRDDSGAAVY